MYIRFQNSYYHQYNSKPLPSPTQLKSLALPSVINCSWQGESMKSSAIDFRLELERMTSSRHSSNDCILYGVSWFVGRVQNVLQHSAQPRFILLPHTTTIVKFYKKEREHTLDSQLQHEHYNTSRLHRVNLLTVSQVCLKTGITSSMSLCIVQQQLWYTFFVSLSTHCVRFRWMETVDVLNTEVIRLNVVLGNWHFSTEETKKKV